ncbi:hypothetical protein PP459_gp095 [Streptomyces phage Wakanda]|uniref:Uncharacterized protein n=2 Tax=Wakandavirus TaxID=3044854 RepID=A0A6G8R3F2_9CAUD|nr:hypothetical protein PP459_gp095 [Streptomyces phage Wakanda]YP_010652459.1 hypothetical protein PP460_gp099 [Streptomyces phage Muntaha]QIN94138.1 hypothetical protein SEA_WAKANDA_177 [Streptomyces phage Wakanda]QIN94703.1 hypothetical protein SEA_MUNTAHA_179 [Streptomyces phage Muntaha]
MSLFYGTPKIKGGSFWRRHSLSLALLALFLIQSVIVWTSGYSDWAAEQQASKQPVEIWPDFVIFYVYEMTVSLVADTYGALLLVLFAKWFYEQGSPESNDKE